MTVNDPRLEPVPYDAHCLGGDLHEHECVDDIVATLLGSSENPLRMPALSADADSNGAKLATEVILQCVSMYQYWHLVE